MSAAARAVRREGARGLDLRDREPRRASARRPCFGASRPSRTWSTRCSSRRCAARSRRWPIRRRPGPGARGRAPVHGDDRQEAEDRRRLLRGRRAALHDLRGVRAHAPRGARADGRRSSSAPRTPARSARTSSPRTSTFLLMAAAASLSSAVPGLREDLWKRYTRVILDGLRPECASEAQPAGAAAQAAREPRRLSPRGAGLRSAPCPPPPPNSCPPTPRASSSPGSAHAADRRRAPRGRRRAHLRDDRPGDRRADLRGRPGRRRGRRPRRRRRPRGARRPAAQGLAVEARRAHVHARRADQGQRRGARRARVARQRQAAGRGQGRHRRLGRPPALLRRLADEDRGRDDPGLRPATCSVTRCASRSASAPRSCPGTSRC